MQPVVATSNSLPRRSQILVMHTIVPIKAARKRFVGYLIIVTRVEVPEQAVQSENLLSNEV